MKMCPRCGETKMRDEEVTNALSRRDNETSICSDCGTDEALFDFCCQSQIDKLAKAVVYAGVPDEEWETATERIAYPAVELLTTSMEEEQQWLEGLYCWVSSTHEAIIDGIWKRLNSSINALLPDEEKFIVK